MDPPVIDLSHVRKVYRGRIEALRDVSLSVPRGCVFGLLGPNGAGKSTLVKILTTIIKATACEGSLLGHPVGHKPTLRRVGYLPEQVRFPSYLTGEQVIEYAAGLGGVPVSRMRDGMGQLLERVRMTDWSRRRFGTYSKGMKQRIGIAQALINDPELVFLDEPTDGVDPEGRRDIRHLVGELRAEGRTVFINTHLLSELEQVADRVAILSKGRIVREGTLEELTVARRHYEVLTEGPVPPDVARQFGERGLRVEGDRVALEAGGAEAVQPVIDALRSRSVVIRSVTEKRLSLEDLFFEAVHEGGEGGNS